MISQKPRKRVFHGGNDPCIDAIKGSRKVRLKKSGGTRSECLSWEMGPPPGVDDLVGEERYA